MHGVYVALNSPASEELEPEFNRWFSAHHFPEVLSLPGVKGVSQYRCAAPDAEYAYMTVWDLEGPDLQAIVAGIRAASPQRTPTNAIRRDPPMNVRLFELIERQEAPETRD
jgi:hypothetical protein